MPIAHELDVGPEALSLSGARNESQNPIAFDGVTGGSWTFRNRAISITPTIEAKVMMAAKARNHSGRSAPEEQIQPNMQAAAEY